MLKPQLYKNHTSIPFSKTLLLHHKPFLPDFSNLQKYKNVRKNKNSGVGHAAKSNIKAVVMPVTDEKTKVTATIGVRRTEAGFLSNLDLNRAVDNITDLFSPSIQLELVAAELDPKTGLEKNRIRVCAYMRPEREDTNDVIYECKFEVGSDFGDIGGAIVENEHNTEMFFSYIQLHGLPNGTLNLVCESWVHSLEQRIFFTTKSYLPLETPNGLKRYRESELVAKRGDGTGEREDSDRIYDYDVYNDLGNPDEGEANARPILGGKDHPYPRRCRTGRPRTKQDPLSESRGSSVYVPRDEQFSEVKSATFNANTINTTVMKMLSELGVKFPDDREFSNFNAIDNLYGEGATLINDVPRLFKKTPTTSTKDVIFFATPEILLRDKFKWMTDEEFGRQTLAGPNPFFIQLVTTNYLQERLIKSKLDTHKEHQPCESAITREMVEKVIRDYESVEEAVAAKKLFVIDYLDLLLPYVNKVRELKGTTLYGSRALFYLTPLGTLRPIAIELVRPPGNGKPLWKEAYCPGSDSTSASLWKLAKTHFLAHDSAFHQLVSHWLRTHCATEPYLIATNRQLSDLHPIYRLLHPHFRYTMEINAQARQNLINYGGFIESTFSPGKYSIELSSVAYNKLWYFDKQGLPDDLVSRGMAEEDSSALGYKLTIEDYPYASDGLILWDCIKQWVSDYVNHYYPEPTFVESDQELQEWWTEIRTVGHADKKDDLGWLPLKTPQDLIKILTIIIWVTSAHHAAVNFGQYDYSGYFPNRPTIARVKMPSEDPATDDSSKTFELRSDDELLSHFPTQIQAVKVIAVLDVLSNHSDDEEYIGGAPEPAWKDNPEINEAFDKFSKRLKELEGIIDARNIDEKLRNRTGDGVVPYKLLKPTSKSGVTGQGVPNSISI